MLALEPVNCHIVATYNTERSVRVITNPKASEPIAPERLYTRDQLMASTGLRAAGIRAARRSGLRVLYVGAKAFVKGQDFITYVEQAAKETR